ncbi:hypothetical protein [Haladaptatus cibarius]|uniref:hypothetical protein n=1 Tax=Haladaptatus cibarius TaxID=453847 RepID=UPI0011867E54|nr:hypothetical protein [Haladaptatus cibarius]
MCDKNSHDSVNSNRRHFVKAVGSLGVGLGVTSYATSSETTASPPDICTAGATTECNTGGAGVPPNITLNASVVGRYVSEDEYCQLLAGGCGIATALAAADGIPGDEVKIATACGSATGGCNLWNVFKDKHGGSTSMSIFQLDESGGSLDVEDYIVVPTEWDW